MEFCCAKDEDGLARSHGKVWIPVAAYELKLKLLAIVHAGTVGHRGADATVDILLEEFLWKGMRRDVSEFVDAFLLCVMSKASKKVPRPLSTTLHACKPNQVIQFNYLFLGTSSTYDMYNLVAKDDLSGYCWIEATASANSEHACSVLEQRNRTFTTPGYWVSDQGSHFINEIYIR